MLMLKAGCFWMESAMEGYADNVLLHIRNPVVRVCVCVCVCIARLVLLPVQVAKLAYRNKRFAAIDRAISRNGLKFVTLLRLSPLLPLAVSNYLYGLTSVDLGSYVLGSWLGMLPGEAGGG
jgi:uncharacterized membrane protein YdjX (TVP38/TMEM64 family)